MEPQHSPLHLSDIYDNVHKGMEGASPFAHDASIDDDVFDGTPKLPPAVSQRDMPQVQDNNKPKEDEFAFLRPSSLVFEKIPFDEFQVSFAFILMFNV